MIKHEDGSTTLTKEELEELNKAYHKLYGIISRMPSSLQDYCRYDDEYANIGKWSCFLEDRPFDRSDWIDDEDEEDE